MQSVTQEVQSAAILLAWTVDFAGTGRGSKRHPADLSYWMTTKRRILLFDCVSVISFIFHLSVYVLYEIRHHITSMLFQ